MRCGVDSLEDMSERTVKASGVWPVNTSVDSTVSNSADTVIVLCVSVKNKCLANANAQLHTIHILTTYIDRSGRVVPSKTWH